MEWVALLCVVTLGFVVSAIVKSERKRLAYWRYVASERGLALTSRTRVFGTSDGRLVEVRLKSGARGHRRRVTLVRVRGKQPADLRLGDSGLLMRMKKPRAETGDPGFDARCVVGGDAALVLAVFDGPTRTAVLEARQAGFTYAAGEWQLVLSGAATEGLGEAIDEGLRLTRAFETPTDVTERLSERAARDPSTEARLMCLSMLLSRYREAPPTLRALEYARTHEQSPQIRLLAARATGDVGLLASVALALVAPGRDLTSVEAASSALELLGRRFPHTPEAEAVLTSWLEARTSDPRARLALTVALGDIHHPEAGRYLLEVLEHGESEAIRCAAIGSLGRVGTLEAVPHLVPYRDKVFSVVLKAAARDAIQKIQLRSGAAPGGSLSLALHEGAGLALFEGDVSRMGENSPVGSRER